MNNFYLNRAKKVEQDFIDDCFRIICGCVSVATSGELHFNKEEYIHEAKNKDGKFVPFVFTKHGDVEMYSEDGWNSLEDLGHWTDLAIDIVMSVAAGCPEKYGYEPIHTFKVKPF